MGLYQADCFGVGGVERLGSRKVQVVEHDGAGHASLGWIAGFGAVSNWSGSRWDEVERI